MEPATKQDLKDLLQEFREEFRRGIREAVAAGFGNSKPALAHATTPAASHLLSTAAPASHTTIVDVVPELAASSARAKPLNVDAPGAAAPTPTTCSTDGSGHDSGGNGSVAVSLLPQGMIRSFTAPLEASLTQPSRLFLVPGPDKMAPTRCLTICFDNDIDMLASVFRPDMTPSITPYGRPLRPEPWPSFSGKSTCTVHGGIVEPTPSTARVLGRAVVPCPALQPLRPTLEVSPTLSTRSGHGVPIGCRDASHYWGSIPRVGTALQERQKCCIIREPRQPWSPPWPRPMRVTVSSSGGNCFLSDSVQWQPWPPPLRDGIRHMRHMFRPRPWPWFKFHLDAGSPDEPYSVCCCELIPREGPFIYLPGTQLPSWRPSVLATSDPTPLSQEEAIHWEQVNYKGMQFSTWCLEQLLESGEHFIRCETAYGFYWERFALAVEIFREQLWLLQPKPTRISQDWGSMPYFNQRPPGVYGLANFSTVSLCLPSIFGCIPALFADDSVQHLVIPTSASIQIAGAQCKCLCTNSCLFCKWLVEVESSKNKKVIWQSSMEYFWRVCVIVALNMPIPITLTSNLCPTRGIIFPSYGSLLYSGSHDPIICLESTSATYATVLPDQITPMYSACTVDVFGDPLSTASPLSCHQSITKGAQIVSNLAQYPYACFVLDNPPLELEAECLLTDMGMRPFSTVPYITLAIISDVFDPRNASPSAGFYSRHFATANPIYLLHAADWIAHLLGSTSASGDHLEQLWDPGGLASYLCRTHAVTSPMHYLFDVWLACVLSICIQLRMEKPMASGELNQWMTINFLFGTLELDCRLDKLIVLLGSCRRSFASHASPRGAEKSVYWAHMMILGASRLSRKATGFQLPIKKLFKEGGVSSLLLLSSRKTSSTTSVTLASTTTTLTTPTPSAPSSMGSPLATTSAPTSLKPTPTSAATTIPTKSRNIKCNGIRAVLAGVGFGSSRISRREGC